MPFFQSADPRVDSFVAAHRVAWMSPVMHGITIIGSWFVITAIVGLVGLVGWIRFRSWVPIVYMAAASIGATVISETVKNMTARARPPASLAIAVASGSSFPSGHTIAATATLAMAAALISAEALGKRHRVWPWMLALVLASLVGFSRLYLGVHWLSDVVFGLLLGLAWVAAILIVFPLSRLEARARVAQPA